MQQVVSASVLGAVKVGLGTISQLYLDAIIQDGREEHETQALVEMVDRSELTEPGILIADRGYEAYNNMAHIEQKGWNYLIRVKDKQGILSGLKLPDALEFDAVFSYSLSKRLTKRIRQEPQKYRWIPSKVSFFVPPWRRARGPSVAAHGAGEPGRRDGMAARCPAARREYVHGVPRRGRDQGRKPCL